MICQRYIYTEGSIDESFFNETLRLHRRMTPPPSYAPGFFVIYYLTFTINLQIHTSLFGNILLNVLPYFLVTYFLMFNIMGCKFLI